MRNIKFRIKLHPAFFDTVKHAAWFFTAITIMLAPLYATVIPVTNALVNQKKYTIKNIHIIGNTKYPERKILEMISFRKNSKTTIANLEEEIKVSNARILDDNLFIFSEINYEVTGEDMVDVHVSLAENVILLEIMALPGAGLTRFDSLTEKAPDFGFLVGGNEQALYLRFPYVFSSPLNLSAIIGHQTQNFKYDPVNPYDYENIYAKLSLETAIAPWLRLKVPALLRYNTKGLDGITKDTLDFAPAVAMLMDFSHLKNVYMVGFDLGAQLTQGIARFEYTIADTSFNLYFKPAKWEELILRARYRKVFSGVPDYLLGNISGEYMVRGNITNHYFGRETIVFNAENWFRNVISIPVKITSINISFMAFADIGTGYDDFSTLSDNSWNLSAGGALEVTMSNPLNLAIEMGYGYELLQNTGGNFYVKFGRKFYKGNFYE